MALGDVVQQPVPAVMEHPDLTDMDLSEAVEATAEFLVFLLDKKAVGAPLVLAPLKHIVESHLRTMAYFQGHWAEQVRENVDFVCEPGPDRHTVTLSLMPKTDLGREAIQEFLARQDEPTGT